MKLVRRFWLYAALVVGVTVIWSIIYDRIPFTARFCLPVEYREDSLFALGIFKGMAELPPPWDLHIHRLNAPLEASWNDFPYVEKLLFYTAGILARFFDLGASANLILLLGYITNALSFTWAARHLGATRESAALGALLFAFSTYMIWRGSQHVVLLWCAPLPWLVYLVRRLQSRWSDRSGLGTNGLLFFAVAGSLNVYYFVFIYALLTLVLIRLLVIRRMQKAMLTCGLLAFGFAVFLFSLSNVFLNNWLHGPNPDFSGGRALSDHITYGLRLPDLFLPAAHPIQAFARYAQEHHASQRGGFEPHSAFLGTVGCVGLVALTIAAVRRGMQGRFERIPAEAWCILFTLSFALVGCGNYSLAVLGFTWLRCSNRLSIFVLCCVLLWCCRVFSRYGSRAVRLAVAAGLVATSTYESSYVALTERGVEGGTNRVESDRAFGANLESSLPRGAAVFQLPPIPFPEGGSPPSLNSYDALRPFLWTNHLRFSFGTHRGRGTDSWQYSIANAPVPALIEAIRARQFQALVIFRDAYPEGANELQSSLQRAGLKKIVDSPNRDLVAYALPTGS